MPRDFTQGTIDRQRNVIRRLMQHDVDIKRLWRTVKNVETLGIPNFDGPTGEPPAQGGVLILSGDASLMGTAESIYDSAFASAGSSYVCDVYTVSSLPSSGITLDDYALFFYDAPATTDPAFKPILADTNINAWLGGSKQRRLVILRSGTYVAPLLTALGIAITAGSGALGTTAPNPRASVATSHYLTAGLSSLSWFLCDIYFGGDPIYTFYEASPPSGYPAQDFNIVTAQNHATAGAEVLVSGSSRWLWQHATANTTFLTNLYPGTLIGGIPVA